MASSEGGIDLDETVAAWRAVDVLRCRGTDAVTFLQGQLSQDVAALAVGSSAWSLLLAPQGKIDAWIRVHRLAETELLVEVDAGWGEAVLARLSRFKLRVECEFSELEAWRCLEVRGPEAGDLPSPPAALRSPSIWPGSPGVDFIGDAFDLPEGVVIDETALELRRIHAGVPRMGSELDDSVIPAEAGPWLVDVSASFTKGCYVGQELVARVESRGSNTPRRLRGVRSADLLAVGDQITDAQGKVVGAVTSAITGTSGSVALAFIARSLDVPATPEVPGTPVVVGTEAAEVFEVPVIG